MRPACPDAGFAAVQTTNKAEHGKYRISHSIVVTWQSYISGKVTSPSGWIAEVSGLELKARGRKYHEMAKDK